MLLPLALLTARTLVVGIVSEPGTLEPHRATDVVSAVVVANVCDPLVRFSADGSRAQAALATSWATRDRRTWTFTLRRGVTFHDGTPLDADAVIANLESLRRARAFPGRAERLGPHVVAITLDRPNAALLATLSQPYFSMQSPRALRGDASRPVGTGPFRLAAVRKGEIELQAHPEYWGGPPRLERVVFRRYAGQEAVAQALLRGEIDVTSAVSQERVDELHVHAQVTLDSQTGLNIAFLSMNNDRGPFRDVRVRQAVSRAIDRMALVRDILGGHGERARNPLPPSLWGYSQRTRELVLDRPAARRLLAQAGYPDGFEATLMAVDASRPYMPSPLRLAARIAEDLGRVGIRVRVKEVGSWAEYLERATRGDYEMAVLGWQADSNDPNDFLTVLLSSEAIGTTNRSRYSSPAMDALLKQARRGGAQRERTASYAAAQALFQKDMPWVPLYHVSVFTAYRRSVQGLVAGTSGVLRFDKVWKKP